MLYLVLWVVAVVLVILGVVKLTQEKWVLGVVLIVAGLLIGPGGVSVIR